MKQVENLRLILSKLKTLKPKEFDFSSFVTEFDRENGCGTVCCVVGWFPKWFPNSGLIWKNDDLECVNEKEEIKEHLVNLLQLPYSWIEYLFFGKERPVKDVPMLSYNSKLKTLINAYEKTIEYLEQNPDIFKCKYSLT